MLKKLPTFLTLLLICTICLPCFDQTAEATNYYVRNGGSDSAAGTSPTTAWGNIPGTAASSKSLSPGDVVYCDRDSTWTLSGIVNYYSTWVPEPGVTYNGSDWEYDGGTSGTRARIEYTGSLVNSEQTSIILFGRDNASYPTTVYGFEIDGNSREANGVLIKAIYNSSTTIDNGWKVFENNVLHHLTNHCSSGHYNYGIRTCAATNIWGNDGTKQIRYLKIINNTIYHVPRVGIMIYPSPGSTNNYERDYIIRGNDISDIGYDDAGCWSNCGYSWGPAIAIKGFFERVTIENNYIHGLHQGGDAILITTPDGAFGTETDMVIRNNIIDCGNTECIMERDYSQGSDADYEFYGNIVYNGNNSSCNNSGLSVSPSGGTASWKIYNNTFYEAPLRVGSGPFTSLHVQNNISYGNGSGITVSETGSHVTVSNNLTTNPSFKNTNNHPDGWSGTYEDGSLAPNKDGLTLVSDSSAACGTGVNLGSSYNQTIEQAITRPSSGAWDIGAYEYRHTLAAPENLKILLSSP